MKRFLLFCTLGLAVVACNTLPQPQTKALGILEVELNPSGTSSARFERSLTPQAVTLREAGLVLGTGSNVVLNSTKAAHEYLMATFPVSHAAGSSSAFQNLTFYALAQSGNIGGTAIKSITNFGGVTNTAEQARLSKHLVPVQAVEAVGGNIVIRNSQADFQAFTAAEVTAATTASSSLLNAGDTILNYGFSARCATTCTANSRQIPTNGTGNITIAIRVPKSIGANTYKFVMNFVVLDESVARVTRGGMQDESIANAQTRGTSVGATRLMQFGLSQAQTSSSLTNDFVDDVQTSSLGASIRALGIGRIDAGDAHSCGLTPTGKAYCWGNNFNGQLGDGGASGTSGSSLPVAVSAPTGGSVLAFSSISAGGLHTCGITTTGAAYCWGTDSGGRLGNDSAGDSNVPMAVSGGLTFSSISAGFEHTCGINTSVFTAYCWGFGAYGQLGDQTTSSSEFPSLVRSQYRFLSISAGQEHTCGIATTGAALCWGDNTYGQLGLSLSINFKVVPELVSAPSGGSALTFSSIAAGVNHTCGITTTGAAYCWGYGDKGQLGNPSTSSTLPVAVSAPSVGSVLAFSSISVGSGYSCGITTSGAAYCWGFGAAGQLGNGSTGSSSLPVLVSGGLTFSSLLAGFNHVCGITTTGTAHCWGRNSNGQLGNGNTSDSSVPVGVDSTNFGL